MVGRAWVGASEQRRLHRREYYAVCYIVNAYTHVPQVKVKAKPTPDIGDTM
jgi:hypothetical protein